MPHAAGDKLGPYEILAPIGKGGMGEVYRARDTKLDRDVAIKVLPAALAQDPERLARFEREAKVLASLNHPNIAQIYGVEESKNLRALVMELVPGETLKGPLPLETALNYAKQIADALEAAHEKGITHRDLKPANIMITPAGVVKVLDFGLAAVTQPSAASEGDPANSPTLTMRATQAGMIMGTAAYMSPEQASGKPVDKRADIWSFGVVLWEMLTGKRLFDGETISHTLAAVLTKEPDLQPVPAEVRRLLQRCLEKDPKRRLRDIGDAWELLEVGQAHSLSTTGHGPVPQRWPWVAAAGTLAVIAAGLAFVHFRETAPEQRSTRFEVAGKSDLQDVALSPDGRYLAFTASSGLWVRPLDSLEARALPGTEEARFPFWSPDSAFLGFFAGGKMKKIAAGGGPAQTLCDAPANRGGTWNRDGIILFAPNVTSGLYRVSAAGGVPAPVTKPAGTVSHRFPEFLPDGRHFSFVVTSITVEASGIYIGSLDGTTERLLPEVSHAAYSAPTGFSRTGHLLFVRDGTLMAQPFDPERLRTTGEAFPIAEQVSDNAGVPGSSLFSVSGPGTLVYGRGAGKRQLVWRDRTGKRLGLIGTPGDISFEKLSPDEKKVAFMISVGAAASSDIWVHDLMRNTTSRFTFGPGFTFTPVWSPDGSRIVYGSSSKAGQGSDIYQKPASGAGQAEVVSHVGTTNVRIYDWSPDGKAIAYSPDINGKTRADLWLLPLNGDRKPVPYLQTEFGEYLGQFSHDGRWMAYTSDESGREQVYVQTVPPSGAKWQISTAGGSRPRWRRDGRELYYVAADQMVMAVPVKPGSSFEAGAPQALFGPILARPGTIYQNYYQPTADGQRFMVNEPAGEESGPPPLTVVLNWQAGLRK
jgi:Tol biopolymer transport system component